MASRFRGNIHRSLDSKGRLMLPPEYRDIICAASSAGSFVLTGFDECLVAYTLPEWEAFEEKIYGLTRQENTEKMRKFPWEICSGNSRLTPTITRVPP